MFHGDHQEETVVEIPSNVHVNDPPEDRPCRHCNSNTMFVDWAQGDRICTTCGIVDEERVCDTRAEWKDFNDAEDIVKGLPSASRCGMVPVDESRYVGGLQPTTLSRGVFGQPHKESNVIRKRLVATNRKLDRFVGKLHNQALQHARLSYQIRKQRLMKDRNANGGETESDMDSISQTNAHDQDVPPEYDKLVLQEEEDIHRAQAALNADKWSLQRAILLHGSADEFCDTSNYHGTESREELTKCLDNTLRNASRDLYLAYSMLQEAARSLQLPDRVTNEATAMLCRYVARRDGFLVKGVSSRLAGKGMGKSNSAIADRQRAEALKRLKEHNKMKQIGALCSAILFLTARNLGWTRSVAEVCQSIQPIASTSPESAAGGAFIKQKHLKRAMDEIKETFPDYAKSVAAFKNGNNNNHTKKNPVSDTANFVDHSLRKLDLPPVAEASIRTLVGHCRREQIHKGVSSGTKLSTICASLAYFVCVAGSVMQRLAKQAQTNDPRYCASVKKATAVSTNSSSSSSSIIDKNSRKRQSTLLRYNSSNSVSKKRKTIRSAVPEETTSGSPDDFEKKPSVAEATLGGDGSSSSSESDEEEEKQFDVFTHDANTEVMSIENREYEMRRVWYTWAEQVPWFRTLGDVEHSCGVSMKVVSEYYKKSLYPRRQKLLEVLRDAVTRTSAAKDDEKFSDNNNDKNVDDDSAAAAREESESLIETPLASTLLSQVCMAGSIMQRQVQKTSCL